MIDAVEAARALTFAIGWDGGELPLYVDRTARPRLLKPEPRRYLRAQALARALDERQNAEVALGVPQYRGSVLDATVLWAWVKGSDQLARAHRFRPVPSIVLQIGSTTERLLLWTLRKAEGISIVDAANERISYALHAPRTRSSCARLRVPVPGTFLRLERARPVPIVATRLELDSYTSDDVAGRLKAPPSRDAWRERR